MKRASGKRRGARCEGPDAIHNLVKQWNREEGKRRIWVAVESLENCLVPEHPHGMDWPRRFEVLATSGGRVDLIGPKSP